MPVVLRQASLKLQNISALFCGLILMVIELISLSVPKYPFHVPQTFSVEGSAVFTKEENKMAIIGIKSFKVLTDQLLMLHKSKD